MDPVAAAAVAAVAAAAAAASYLFRKGDSITGAVVGGQPTDVQSSDLYGNPNPDKNEIDWI